MGWDSVDRQILGQLRPLADKEEEEEEEGAEATCPLGPAFPGMGSEELRLASFHNWLLSFSVHPAQRAKAGFFHTDPLEELGDAASTGAESTEEQLRHLRQERICKVYLDQAVAMVFMPCSHLVCAECAPNLCLCPICWVPIHSCIHTFLS